MKKYLLVLALAGLFTSISSCKKETIEPKPEPDTTVVTTNEPVAMNLQVYSFDDGNGFAGYDFKVVIKSPNESVDSLSTTFSNYSDGVTSPNFATLQCNVDTSLVYTIDIYDNANNYLLTVPLEFHWEDYILAVNDDASSTITGEVFNHDNIETQNASQAHVVLAIGK